MSDPSVSVDAIKKAYTEPVRTVMLVDDRFRTFSQLARRSADPNAPAEGNYEDDRAASLWEACRLRGWACDVENGPVFTSSAKARIRKCDLIVLDFHLVGQDSSHSIEIMTDLAESPGSNLVILYTIDPNLDNVRRTVAANLRGTKSFEGWLDDETKRAWEDLPESVPAFSTEHVDGVLRGDRSFKGDPALQGELEEHSVPKRLQAKVLEAAMERYLETTFQAKRTSQPRHLQMSGREAVQRWLRQDNVFIVFVSKEADHGASVFDALDSALANWQPSPLHVTAAYARDAIKRGGFRLDTAVLSDSHLRSGWIFHALEETPILGFRNLCERLVGSVTDAVIDEVAEFGAGLIPTSTGEGASSSNLERARSMALLPTEPTPKDPDIILALNDFLCCEAYRGNHVRTGTIFARADGEEQDIYWICVTPACDMVPRPAGSDQWEGDLHPLRPMTVLR